MIPLPNISAGGGGPSGSSSNAGISTPITIPFNFDNSGWAVNIHGNATQSPTGNSGANATTQQPAGLLSSLMGGGVNPLLLVGGLAVLLLLRR